MTYHSLFPALPDAAHVWVYPTSDPPSATAQEHLLTQIRTFMRGWRSHGRATSGDINILFDRFIVAAGSLLSGGPLSGCSIDSMTHAIEDAAHGVGISLVTPMAVFYRAGEGGIQSVSRGYFRRMVHANEVHADTPVFDLGVTSVGALRGGAFELPFRESWHARVFRPQPEAVR